MDEKHRYGRIRLRLVQFKKAIKAINIDESFEQVSQAVFEPLLAHGTEIVKK